ncbi:MAG: hypothetical protein FWH08_01310 [Oscillospiraceae bacterium]|nr:hypothetical protein [Oscillospiraceae bacterium]
MKNTRLGYSRCFRFFALTLALIFVLSACTDNTIPDQVVDMRDAGPAEDSNTGVRQTGDAERQDLDIDLDNLLENMQDRHATSASFEYTAPIFNVARDHVFVFEGATYYDRADEWPWDDFTVYLEDPAFNPEYDYFSNIDYDWNTHIVTIGPGYTPALDVWNEEPEPHADWGNAPMYWLVQRRDIVTGEVYEKPLVTAFTVQNELDTPTVSFSVTSDGYARFEWNPIEGAEKYSIYEISISEDYGLAFASLWVAGETANVSFVEFENQRSVSSFSDEIYGMNGDFYTGYAYYRTAFCVVAENAVGRSAISNFIFADEYSNRLPSSRDYSYAGTGGETESSFFETAFSLPSHAVIRMCDGETAQRLIDYRTATYEKTSSSFDSSLKLSVKILGTDFTDELYLWLDDIYGDAEAEYLRTLAFLIERQDRLTVHASGITPDNNISHTPPVDTVYEGVSDLDLLPQNVKAVEAALLRAQNGEFTVYANTALSEYIALNLIQGVNVIDVNPFKEAFNWNVLVNAVNEAFYQNPLAGSMTGFEFDYSTGVLTIYLVLTPEELKSMQTAVIAEVDGVISEIIKPGMSDLEKQIAINNYLIQSAEYDMAALENGEKNNFEYVDKEFIHSFTPYGILINKVGVCASYAGAFKLLCDKAELESVVVTGYLDGTLPHAWNRVNIDGHWMTVDVTNNDGVVENALFNIPDRIASGILIENDNYVFKPVLDTLTGTAEDFELYRLEGSYYPLSELKTGLSEGLRDGESFVIRTDYDVSDEDVVITLFEEALASGTSDRIVGVYVWLGVVAVVIE